MVGRVRGLGMGTLPCADGVKNPPSSKMDHVLINFSFRQAWNTKPKLDPTSDRKWTPTAETVESGLIFIYGCSNVFLEHLASWGDAWSHSDLQHISIAFMFFGGGLV
jgi:hypothetical protein